MPPPTVGTIKQHVVVDDTNGMVYCNLITPPFVSDRKVRSLRTFINPTAVCNEFFEILYYVSVEKRTLRDIRIKVVDTLGNLIAFKDS